MDIRERADDLNYCETMNAVAKHYAVVFVGADLA